MKHRCGHLAAVFSFGALFLLPSLAMASPAGNANHSLNLTTDSYAHKSHNEYVMHNNYWHHKNDSKFRKEEEIKKFHRNEEIKKFHRNEEIKKFRRNEEIKKFRRNEEIKKFHKDND